MSQARGNTPSHPSVHQHGKGLVDLSRLLHCHFQWEFWGTLAGMPLDQLLPLLLSPQSSATPQTFQKSLVLIGCGVRLLAVAPNFFHIPAWRAQAWTEWDRGWWPAPKGTPPLVDPLTWSHVPLVFFQFSWPKLGRRRSKPWLRIFFQLSAQNHCPIGRPFETRCSCSGTFDFHSTIFSASDDAKKTAGQTCKSAAHTDI